jgi:hypothetical protein
MTNGGFLFLGIPTQSQGEASIVFYQLAILNNLNIPKIFRYFRM